MTGLAAVLDGLHAPGVYRWHAAYEADEVAHLVTQAGWRFGYVDGWHQQTAREALTAIGEALAFPDYYGRNLDALRDCLRDLDHPVVLLWDGWSTLARHDERAFGIILEILGEFSPTLTTLLRGEGPELGVPSLD